MNTSMLPLIGQPKKLLDAMLATILAGLGCAASKSLLALDKGYKGRLVQSLACCRRLEPSLGEKTKTEATSILLGEH